MKKALIFDSSSIITLAMNNLLSVLPKLKEGFDGSFFITPQVKEEVIDRPLTIRRFELEALMVLDMIKKGVLEVMNPPSLAKETERVRILANSMFAANREKIKILHSGESSCFALASLLKDHDSLLVVDERTSRMLVENPENLRKLFESKLHTSVIMNKVNMGYFKNANVIRSSELCLVSYKKGLIELPAPSKQAVEALLYASKFKGCSISNEEISEAMKLF